MFLTNYNFILRQSNNYQENQIFPSHELTLTKGLGDGVPSPMGERPRVGDRRKGTREIGVWGVNPPVEVLSFISKFTKVKN